MCKYKELILHLRLKNKTEKVSKTGEKYIELLFEYPDGSKQVKYWVWSFVHNELNSLKYIWDAAIEAKVGNTYSLHFKKAEIAGRIQFVITLLQQVDKPITYLL